jgi:hypothetical protein
MRARHLSTPRPLRSMQSTPFSEFTDCVGFSFDFTESATRTPDSSSTVAALTLLGVHEFVRKHVDQTFYQGLKIISAAFELSVLVGEQLARILRLRVYPNSDSVLPTSASIGMLGVDYSYSESFDPRRSSEPNDIPNYHVRDVCFIRHSHVRPPSSRLHPRVPSPLRRRLLSPLRFVLSCVPQREQMPLAPMLMSTILIDIFLCLT